MWLCIHWVVQNTKQHPFLIHVGGVYPTCIFPFLSESGVLVMPIEGRGRHLDPKQIPLKYRDIHLVEFKFCSDINPQQTLEKAHNQHQPLIQRLIQRLQNKEPEASLDATKSHFILLGVGGTIYNPYTITPLLNLGIPLRKVHQLATARHCHAIKSFNKITKTRNKIQSTTTTVLID